MAGSAGPGSALDLPLSWFQQLGRVLSAVPRADVTSGSLRVEVGGYPIPLAAASSDDGVITDISKGDDNS